tara:strand:+ start:360 stop:584 length:225 start_codon:yes stop_codon:yes gene_type:complete
MGYVETDNIKFVLTNYGKEQTLKYGLSNVIKYFSVSDDGVIYTMYEEPNKLLDVNGSHQTSTNITSCNKNLIQK